MGCCTALELARANMRVLLIEQRALGGGTSRSNMGSLLMQSHRLALLPYARAGYAFWQELGYEAGFVAKGSLSLAFSPEEAALLERRTKLRQDAGVGVEMISLERLQELEPGLSDKPIAAAYAPEDAAVNSNRHHQLFTKLLSDAGVHVLENTGVYRISVEDKAIAVLSAGECRRVKRLVVAAGAWSGPMLERVGLRLPIQSKALTLSVTERTQKRLSQIILHAMGSLQLSQTPIGATLIGGGWEGLVEEKGGSGRVDLDTLLPNLRLAQYAAPYLNDLRLIRAWTAMEATTPDSFPLVGSVVQDPDVYVLAGCPDGYLAGPGLATALASRVLDRSCAFDVSAFSPLRFQASALAGTEAVPAS